MQVYQQYFIYRKYTYMFWCICIIFVYLAKVTKIIKVTNSIKVDFIGPPEDDADVSKHVGVLVKYKILFMYIYCAFVGLDNKLYKMHSSYIQI